MTGTAEEGQFETIAVVGLSGRFPGQNETPEQLWTSVGNYRDCGDYLMKKESEDRNRGGGTPECGGCVTMSYALDNIEYFDRTLFGISPSEAELMDPQQRIMLECAWTALEDAGYNPLQSDLRTGVFVGARTNTYLCSLVKDPDLIRTVGPFHIGLANDSGFLAMRISHCLNLTGPSIAVHTACSTSLVCVHLAMQSLFRGECDMALAGGVAVEIPHALGYEYEEGGVLAPDGVCRPFDAKARGTVFGSGVGVVVLRRLSDAIADGDFIYATILGSAVNNDGAYKASFSAPSVQGQIGVLNDAIRDANILGNSVTYVEAHGTGTLLGDAIEIRALERIYGRDRTKKCAVGSIKGNVGHLDAAAGVTGLIKTVLSLHHGMLPPSLHFDEPNPQIDFDKAGLYVNTELRDWPANGSPRRAAVSAFGVGGTNAHVVLEEAPQREESDESRRWQILVCSGKTAKAEQEVILQLRHRLDQPRGDKLADIAFTLATGRQRFAFRRAAVCRDISQAVGCLTSEECVIKNGGVEDSAGVAFLLSESEMQDFRMIRQLYMAEDVFRREMDRCSDIIEGHCGIDLKREMLKEHGEEYPLSFLHPVLVAAGYGLAQVWLSWGVKPDVLLGYGLGEFVAATISGTMGIEDAVKLLAYRGRLLDEFSGGSLAELQADEHEVKTSLRDEVWVASVSDIHSCMISGAEIAVESMCKEWEQRGRKVRRLSTRVAYYCPMMAPIAESLRREMGKINLSPPRIRCISSITGQWIQEEFQDPEYWVTQLQSPLRLAQAIESLSGDATLSLVEVGIGDQISAKIRAKDPTARVMTSITGQDAQESMLKALAGLWCYGADISWPVFYGSERRFKVPLPTYPFQRKRYWIDPPLDHAKRKSVTGPGIAVQKSGDLDGWFWSHSWKATTRQVGRGDPTQRWLILQDDMGIADHFEARLRTSGAAVVTARPGTEFNRLSANNYCLSPFSKADWSEFAQTLLDIAFIPTHLICAWDISAALESRQAGYSDPNRLISDVSSLSNGLMEFIERGWKFSVAVLGTNCIRVEERDIADPTKAPLLALCKILPQENPGINAIFVDIGSVPCHSDRDRLVDAIIGDLQRPRTSATIAYRGTRRWMESYEPAYTELPGGIIRDEGVYLITGGMGAVGRLIAKHLIRKYRARVVLVGHRSAHNPVLLTQSTGDQDCAALIEEAAATGGEVQTCAAAVEDENDMREAVRQSLQRFGTIHGVIHAAGVTHGSSLFKLIKDTCFEDCLTQSGPKLGGLRTLEKVVEGLRLDFVLAMSSNAAVLGGLGFLSYATANCAMDIFVTQRQFDDSLTRWISANWDHWPAETRKYGAMRTSMEDLAMTHNESTEALERVLGRADSGQIVVSTGNLQARIGLWIETRPDGKTEAGQHNEPSTRMPRPRLRSQYIEPRNDVELKLAQVWADLLGLDKVGVKDDFFELGGHSLLAAKLLTRSGQAINTTLPLKALFLGPTVAQLAQFVSDNACVSA